MSAATPVSIHSERGRRPMNQDAALIHRFHDGRELVAVADGMGGHAAGEVASRRALEVLREALETGLTLERAVTAANAAIRQEAADNPNWQGMGTTLVALLRSGASYRLVNVGDSRAYRVNRAGVEQITADHSYSAESIRNGDLSAEEAARSPWRGALTRAVGTDEDVEVDVFGPIPTEPPHAVLLCTDGMHGVVSDDTILAFIRDAVDPGEAARLLARAAFDAGSSDNITVAVIAFGFPPSADPGAGADARQTTDTGVYGTTLTFRPRLAGAPSEQTSRSPPSPVSRKPGRWRELVRGQNLFFVLVSVLLLVWFLWQIVNRYLGG